MKHVSIATARSMPVAIPADFERFGVEPTCPPSLRACFDTFIHRTSDPVHFLTADGICVWANASARRCTGGWNASLPSWRWDQAWPEEHRPKAVAAIAAALKRGNARFTAHTISEFGARRDWDVALTRTSARGEDVAELVIAIAREVPCLAQPGDLYAAAPEVDELTGLPNRLRFGRELKRRVVAAEARGEPFALILMDVDGFKQLNSRLGPQASDVLLAQFARELSCAIGKDWFLARSGGDEFALIVPAAGDPGAAQARFARLIRACADQVSTGDQFAAFSVSAGLSIFPSDAECDGELLQNSHTALRAAKAAGRGRCVSFDGRMRQQLQRQSSMLDVARAAIAGDWMHPYYQTKVDLRTGAVVGLEALLRWESADGVVHLPATISAAFDDPEIATSISDLMLQKVIADLTLWKRAGSALPVAINASGADFRDPAFADKFLARLEEAGLPTSLIELEVTEGVFLGVGADDVGTALRRLSAAGVRIALDDFGTGYASLTHLKQHPVDVIKIDRSFVSNLATSPDDRAIVGAMVSLSRNLAIEVVAEGIETQAQMALLRDLGCHTGQGFLFSRAIPSSGVPALVSQPPVDI
ncbi:MAG TPA: bifunctional diguanylate cyclase/phosphodiesterase [Allosphingosinicella sp.]